MKALENVNLDNVLFIDIETVRAQNYIKEGEPLYDSWQYKMRYAREAEKFDSSLEESFKDKAALYAEFAKIACITIGRIKDGKCVLYSIADKDEYSLLKKFYDVIEGLYMKNPRYVLSGHAIVGFDIPFIARRFMINRLPIPLLCDIAHLKPWTVTCLDTLDLWKGTGYYSASLLNIATAFGLPSPKTDIDGSQTSDVYYSDADAINKIRTYCEKDVLTSCNVLLGMMGMAPVEASFAEVKVESKKLSGLSRAAIGMTLTDKDVAEIETKKKKIAKKDLDKANYIIETICQK